MADEARIALGTAEFAAGISVLDNLAPRNDDGVHPIPEEWIREFRSVRKVVLGRRR
jgi:hypothetical protein